MTDQNLFLEHQHPTSRRFAVLEDDGTSVWLYLTEPDSRKPCGDAWVHNRIAAPPMSEIGSYRGGPPPAAQGYASASALCAAPTEHVWSFSWSSDGESVALWKDAAPVAFIVAGTAGGYSRELIKIGGWGHPWDQAKFASVFG